MLGGDDPELLLRDRATRSSTRWQTLPELRAPRVAGDLSRPEIADQAALRSCRRARRDDQRAQPDDPHRDARRHRPEQRQILARRPPGADPRRRCPRIARRDLSTLENLPVPTSSGGSVPLKARRRDRLRRRARRTIQRTNQIRRIVDRRRPRARAASPATHGRRSTQLPTMKNLPAGRPALPARRPEVAGGADLLLHHRADVGRPAGVRGAGAALPPVPVAARQHGLAAAGAARRR